jgi:hypothetical protein
MTLFAYSQDSGKKRDDFKNPERAYGILKNWDYMNFSFFNLPADKKYVKLSGAAFLMAGTTEELVPALNRHKDTLNFLACDQDDVLCVHYIRIGVWRLTAFKNTVSLISVAPLKTWWGPNVDFPSAGRDLKWRYLVDKPINGGINIDNLATFVGLLKDRKAKIKVAEL